MYIGIDLGGTNIAVGLVNDKLEILAQSSRPTNAPRPYQAVVKDMAELCQEVAAQAGFSMADIKGIGMGSPGAIDSINGKVLLAYNLQWDEAPLVAELKSYFPNILVRLENDANAAAYGEFMANGGTADSFLAVTLGTGVGGGIVLHKQIYRGANGIAGELGHFSLIYNGIPCACGRRGCWEAYASVTALIKQTTAAIEKHPDSLMAKYAKENGKVSGRTSFDAAKAGDPVAQKVVDQYIEYVADGISSMINIFQPDMIVIGGGISREGDCLLTPIKQYVMKNIYGPDLCKTEIRTATLFNEAGIIGAALASVL